MEPVNTTPVQPASDVTTTTPSAPAAQQPPVTPETHSGHNKMLLAVAAVAALVVLVVVGAYGYTKINQQKPEPVAQVAPTPIESSPTPSAVPTESVSVTSGADVDKLINEVDSVNTTTMQKNYNQAVTESSGL